MKIVFDGQTFINQTHGGISRYVTRLADELIAMGEEASIVAPLYRNAYLQGCIVTPVHGRKFTPKPAISPFAKIASRIASRRIIARMKPSILHETYYSAIPATPRGTRTILTVYDMIHELHPEALGRFNQTARFKRAAVMRADRIICISENTRRDLVRILDVPWERTDVVLLGADRLPALPSSTSPLDRPYLLYVGARSGYKNFSGLLEAVVRLPSLRNSVDIAAFGGGQFSSEERALMRRVGMQGRVHHFSGDDSILARLYCHATLLVYPSMYEGFGLPPLEAMTLSCPVACSSTSSLPEVVGNAGEYFDPENPDSIAHAIERVLYSDQYRQHLIAAGRQQAARFSWSLCAAQTVKVYRRALEG